MIPGRETPGPGHAASSIRSASPRGIVPGFRAISPDEVPFGHEDEESFVLEEFLPARDLEQAIGEGRDPRASDDRLEDPYGGEEIRRPEPCRAELDHELRL